VTELNKGDWELEWEFLVAEVWANDELMERLLAHPAEVLTERGFLLPEGAQLEVVREAEIIRIRITGRDGAVTTLVLPPRPDCTELTESDLDVPVSGKDCGIDCGGGCGGCGGCGRGGFWIRWGCGGCGGGCGGGCAGRCGGVCAGRCGVACAGRCGGACAFRCRC
jgi:hypothetical protein